MLKKTAGCTGNQDASLGIDARQPTRRFTYLNPFCGRGTTELIVSKPAHLTAQWAQAVIKQQIPSSTNVKIDNVEVVAVDIGTTTRIRLTVDHDIPDFPKRWFVKLPSLSWRARAITALPRLLPAEVRFYNELASQLPLTIPRVIAAQSRFGAGSTLVMNDISESAAVPGKAGSALTPEQAKAVAGQLAHFHAVMTDMAQRDNSLRWLAGPVRRLEDNLGTALAAPLMKRGLQLAGETIGKQLHAGALAYAKNRRQVMRFLATDRPTVVHHDCHPGNLFWQDGRPGFLDWQMVRIGEGVGDLSYFLATALTPETRRACEIGVLRHYHEIMQSKNSLWCDFNTLSDRYRVHLAYPLEAMVVTLAVGGLMQLEANLEMIRRAALAVADHDTYKILPLSA